MIEQIIERRQRLQQEAGLPALDAEALRAHINRRFDETAEIERQQREHEALVERASLEPDEWEPDPDFELGDDWRGKLGLPEDAKMVVFEGPNLGVVPAELQSEVVLGSLVLCLAEVKKVLDPDRATPEEEWEPAPDFDEYEEPVKPAAKPAAEEPVPVMSEEARALLLRQLIQKSKQRKLAAKVS
jgi:hypothetical protein